MIMNFGNWITVAFLAFAAIIISLVVVSMRQEVSLVAADYYQQEIAYQGRIDELTNAKGQQSIELSRKPGENQLTLTFAGAGSGVTGEVHMYRPSDASLDKSLPLSLDDSSTFRIDTSALKKGLWKMKITWKVDGKSYFEEKTIVI